MKDPFSKLQPALADGDEETFRTVVDEHGGLVYQSALRRLNGDHALAQDAAQQVFVELHRKAGDLPADTILPAWLHRQTCFVTSKQVRSAERRRLREAESSRDHREEIEEPSHLWNEIKALIDSAVNSLGDQDRDLLLLRFWSGKSLREAGEVAGISENAAQKRITRAFETLRSYLARYGVTGSVATLTLAVTDHAAGATSATVTGAIAAQALAAKPPGLFEAINPSDWFLSLKAKPILASAISLIAITLGTTGFVAGRKSAHSHYRAINWQQAVDQTALATVPPPRSSAPTTNRIVANNRAAVSALESREPTVSEIVAEAAEHYRQHRDFTPDAWALAYVAARKIRAERIPEALIELEKYRDEKLVFNSLGPIFTGLLAQTDADAALKFAADNFTGQSYDQALREIIQEWAKQDPVKVWNWFSEITASDALPISSSQWLSNADEIFAEWVSLDPQEAMGELQNLSTREQRGAFRGVMKAAMSSPRREEILVLLNELPNERHKRRIARDLAGDWARMNPTEAAQWAESLSFENPAAHLEVLGEVAEEWFPSDPHAAGKWIISHAPEPLRDQVKEMVAKAFVKISTGAL